MQTLTPKPETLPSSPWSSLESSRGLISVPACWRERLGDDFENFRAAVLSKSPEPAKYYPCPLACGCMHEIVPNENGRERDPGPILEPSTFNLQLSTIHAICLCPEPNCPDILLTPDDAILLELNWAKLARSLCAALNLDSKPTDLGLLNTRQIGSWSADAVPVILTIQTDHAWFRGMLLEMIARLRGRFILLAPTSRHLDAICQEMLANANAGFFPLEGNVRLTTGGVLQSVKSPGELFARFTPQPRPEHGEEVARRAFALVEQLGADTKPPTPLTVFRLYCIQALTPARIARKLNCSRPTVLRRLKLIEHRTGVPPAQLRQYSSHLDKIEDEALDSRARKVYRRNLITEAEAE
jgi:hypothetical protein